MKAIVVLELALLVTAIAFEYTGEWELWKTKHGKTYKDDSEELHRKTIWTKNKAFVEEHNKHSDKHGFTVGMNKFADLEVAEFASIYNGYRQDLLSKSKNSTRVYKPSGRQVASSVDWRTKGVVTKVKNQGQCGSCWSFSTTGSLEGQHAINTGNLVSLSEQQLVDCSRSYGNHGCKGGLMDNAFRYLETAKDETEEDYPYLAEDSVCRYDSSKGVVGDTGYTDIASEDEDALLDAVANVGPISVAMDASHMSFQLYHSGVYSESQCSSTQLDHGVLAIGYGVSLSGQSYWLVKNSWGASWGDNGYFMLARNQDNMCGIATQASYPTGVN